MLTFAPGDATKVAGVTLVLKVHEGGKSEQCVKTNKRNRGPFKIIGQKLLMQHQRDHYATKREIKLVKGVQERSGREILLTTLSEAKR